jgi:hypothetical protein
VSAPQRIDEILIDAGLASIEDLARARRRMAERGGSLLSNLVALGRIDDRQLAHGLASRLGLPLAGAAQLTRVAAPRTPSRRAALRALAIERVLLPIGAHREPREVEVAMFDPFDREAIERLRHICGGAAIRVHVAPRRELLEAVARTYGREQSGVLGESHPAEVVFTDIHDRPFEGDPIAAALGAAPLEPIALPAVAPAGSVPPAGPPRPVASSSSPSPSSASVDSGAMTPVPELMREARLYRVLLEATGLLADLLEERASPRPREGLALARAVRAVAAELGWAPVAVDELGLAAQLFAVQVALADEARARGGDADGAEPPSLADALGWAAAAPDGVGQILRALAQPPAGHAPPRGVQVILAVREYLQLAAAIPDGVPDRHTVNQLLRVTTPPDIIEAILRALQGPGPAGHKEQRNAG